MKQFKIALVCFVITSLLVSLLNLVTKSVNATPLTWIQSSGIGSYSQDIRISSLSDHNILATLRTSTQSGLFKSGDNGHGFAEIFALQPNRDVNTIAISNQDSSRIWISTYDQGIFRSIDGGTNWINSGLSSLRVRYITIDPNNDQILYAGTGQNNSDGGIYKTLDGGNTWNQVGASTYGNKNCLNLFVDKNNSNRIFAGSDFNLYVSVDGGDNWTPLSLGITALPATLVDSLDTSTIYSAVNDIGIYKSTDNGLNWVLKNSSMGASLVFRLAQDSSGILYATRLNLGGVWRSKDGAESWENVADPAWGSANTWGLDAQNGVVAVSVEGLGLFVASTSAAPPPPPPPSGPNPVVLVPGLGASFSTKGLILKQPTTYHDWTILPIIAPSIYDPFLKSGGNAGLSSDQLFFFPYDYTKHVSVTGQWLKDFLDNEVIPKNPGKKVNLVGHSLGGLVIRYCIEKVPGCSDKVEKVVTAGTPHQGAVDAYPLWEGAEIKEKDPLLKFGLALLIQINGYPSRILPLDILRSNAPGIQDIMPTFDYLVNLPYSFMSPVGKNPEIEAMTPISAAFKSKLLTLSGNKNKTLEKISTKRPNALEILLGYWTDGKGQKYSNTGNGDNTVLQSSSAVAGVINKNYNLEHKEYFQKKEPMKDILNYLGLGPNALVLAAKETPNAVMMIYSDNPSVSINVPAESDEEIINNSTSAVFVTNPKKIKRLIKLLGKKGQKANVSGIYVDDEKYSVFKKQQQTFNSNSPVDATVAIEETVVESQ